MKYLQSHEEIAQAYARHLQSSDIRLSPEELNAEASLLMMKSARDMRNRFNEAMINPNFVERYGRIIVHSPRPIQDIGAQDLLAAIVDPWEALIVTDPFRRIDDTCWLLSDLDPPARTFFWPHPVDVARVKIQTGADRFKQSEGAIAAWNTAALKIADEQIDGFSRGMLEQAFHVKAVVSDIGGVIALLKFDSRSREEWDEACRATRIILQRFGVTEVAFRAERIVPLPTVPKGRGTILYLA